MRKVFTVAIILLSLLLGVYLGYNHNNRQVMPEGSSLSVSFLTRNLGNAIIIKTPEGKTIVIDPGSRRTESDLIKYLRSIHAKSIAVMITNAASTHTGSVQDLIDDYPVTTILRGENTNKSKIWVDIQDHVKEKSIPQIMLSGGDTVKLSQSTSIEVLSPPKGLLKNIDYSTDNNSLIIRMSYRGKRFLITSDIRTQAESALIQSGVDSSSDFLVVPHHGLRGSASLELLSVVRPEYCIIQSGNSRPNSSVLRRLDPRNTGAALYRTDEDGIIEILTNGHTTVVNTNRSYRE